jgi:hypothetical protein
MIANADAGVRWLDRTTPDLDKAKTSLKQIIHDGHRAGAIIDGVRAVFKKDPQNRTSLDINELIREALALVRDDLHKHRVTVQAELNEQLPRVKGDRVQVQQVLLNLITNAIDSMAAKNGARVLCVKSKVNDSGGVMLSMEDTGKGVETKTSTGYSIRSSPQNRMAWGWACRFAARLSRHMMAGYGSSPTHPRAPSFSSSCSLTPRCLLVLHDLRNRAISRPGLTSAFGTTCRRRRFMSAIGG